MNAASLRLARQRLTEAALLLASGGEAETIADALLLALDHLEELEASMQAADERVAAQVPPPP